MNRKIIIFIILFIIMLMSSLAYSEGVLVEIASTSNSFEPGDTFTVNITLKNIESFVGGEIIVNYDPGIVELTDKSLIISDSTDFTGIVVTNPNLEDSSGKTMFIFGLNKQTPPLSGDHLIGSLTFRTLSKGEGVIEIDNNSKIIYEDINGNYMEIPYSADNFNYSIMGIGSVSGKVEDNSGNGIENIIVELIQNDSIIYSASTDQNGVFSISGVAEGTYTLRINSPQYIEYNEVLEVYDGLTTNTGITLIIEKYCDITKDGIVDLEDLVFAANYYGITSLDSEWDENAQSADVNDDNRVDVVDLIIITRNLFE